MARAGSFFVYLADGLFPPSAINLPYETTFRFSKISGEKLVESVRTYPVKAVIVTAEYKRNAKLMRWIQRIFPDVHTVLGYNASNVVSAQVYTQSDSITRLSPNLGHDLSTDEPEYVP